MRLEQVLEDALAARVTRGVDGLDLDLGAHAEERVDAGQQLALGGGRERPLTAHPDHIRQQVRAVAHEYLMREAISMPSERQSEAIEIG